jgi:hypothetical protein
MTPFRTVAEVLTAIQTVKAGAADFCTNFFPDGQKLQDWVGRNELFLFRRDRDFSRMFFCAASPAALREGLAALPNLRAERVVAEVVGAESALTGMLAGLEAAGFHRYRKLQRMARLGQSTLPPAAGAEMPVTLAEGADAPMILNSLKGAFDRYAEQLPTASEIESAVAAGQIFVVKLDGKLAGLLFFETQGMTSTLRYWLVAEGFRDRHVGAALMRRYLATQSAVRRFLLWVIASNDNAVQKYLRFGFAPDGLVDHVLASAPIHHENHR